MKIKAKIKFNRSEAEESCEGDASEVLLRPFGFRFDLLSHEERSTSCIKEYNIGEIL